jgi:hypothetical protein
MFLFFTVISVWYYLIFGWKAFDHPFVWGNLAAWRDILSSPTMFRLFFIWFISFPLGLILITIRTQARFRMFTRPRSPRAARSKVNFLMAVDIPLVVAGILLVVYGGVERQLNPLFLGIIFIIGLLLHLAEQWLWAYFS